jgi:hypothetical protein
MMKVPKNSLKASIQSVLLTRLQGRSVSSAGMLGGKDAAEETAASCSLWAVSIPMLLSLVRLDFLRESDDEDEDDETWSSTCEKAGADEISCFGEDIDEQERAGWRGKKKVFFFCRSGGGVRWFK